MAESRKTIDIVSREIIRNGLIAATDEMAKTLVRTAFNPLLYEVQDYGISIVSASGELWAETPGCTIFSRTLPDVIKSGVRTHGVDGFSDGDVLIANDPFETGTHISDTSVYMPVFVDGSLIAFAGTTAHWADIGGKYPGGWCPDTVDTYQEGLCFSHQKLVRNGQRNDDLWDLIATNVRVPEIVKGDLEAQIAACLQGVERIKALCEKFGAHSLVTAMEEVITETARVVGEQIAALPDGEYGANVQLDHDGVDKDGECKICLQVHISGDRIRFAFEGTSLATKGPVNIPAIGTIGAVCSTIKGLLLPHDPTNEGHALCFDFDLPPGLMVSPQRPSPTDSYGYALECLTELMFWSLWKVLPGRCPAGGFQLFGAGFSRTNPRDGEPFVFLEPMDGGNGGQPASDGSTMMFVANGDVPNVPCEVLENRYPLRIDRFGLLTGVEGAGKFRGGFGVRRDYRILESGIVLMFASENTRDKLNRGMSGGKDGTVSRVIVAPGTDREETVLERISFYGPLPVNELVSVRSGGGGGWGDPRERDPALVLADVRNGFITTDKARQAYDVVISGDSTDWQVDGEATESLRAVVEEKF